MRVAILLAFVVACAAPATSAQPIVVAPIEPAPAHVVMPVLPAEPPIERNDRGRAIAEEPAPPATSATLTPVFAPLVIPPTLVKRLSTGMLVKVRLRSSTGTELARCTVTYDLWDEVYKVKRGAAQRATLDHTKALHACLDGTQPVGPVTVDEVP